MLEATQIKPDIWWVGGIDWNARLFHGYTTELGITYNAYLIIDEKITLIDTTKAPFAQDLIDRISTIVDPKKIDYLVSNHVEMDHSGSIPAIMKVAPNATIVTSAPQGLKGLKAHYGDAYEYMGVKTGDTLNIGKRTLEFIQTPMVHWPDNMVTYSSYDKILFSNDAFGQHIATSKRFDVDNDKCEVMKQAKKYYANIVQPYGMQVGKAMKAIGELDFDMVAPSHGVIWTEYAREIFENYASWSVAEVKDKAIIVFDSMWHSTETMARAICEGFIEQGVEAHLYDVKANHPSDIMTEFLDSKYVAIGSPTLNSQMLPPVAGFLTYMKGLSAKNHMRIGIPFGSYGWAPLGPKNVASEMEAAGFELPVSVITCNYLPSEEFLVDLREKVADIIKSQSAEKQQQWQGYTQFILMVFIKITKEVASVFMDIAISIIVTFLLTLANGFFSAAEMALVNAKRSLLERDAEEGDFKAQSALDLSSDSGEFLAAIQVAITLVGFFASAFAATSLSQPFSAWLEGLGFHVGHILAPVLITLIVSFVSIVVGELVPKRIALANAEGVAKSVSGFLTGFLKVVKPLVWLTSRSSDGIAKLLGVASADNRQVVTEEEIKYMVTDADELTDEEKSMIHEIFDLGDTIAREVMVPRVDMTAMSDSSTCKEVLNTMRKTGYSRIPIYHDVVDRVIGVAHIKDIIAPILDQNAADKSIADYTRDATYVPDTKDIIPLLSEMQTSHDQMVIVVDEYGGTAGIVTIEDIVEEVVGEIEDEFDPDNKYLTQLSDREWLVDGRFSLDDAIELRWPIEDSEEFETIAGFVLDLADKLPEPGDVFIVDGYKFRVQTMRGRRIALLRVTAPTQAEMERIKAEKQEGEENQFCRVLPKDSSQSLGFIL